MKPLVDLYRIHYPSSILGLALNMNVDYDLSCRMTVQFFKDLLGVTISYHTIYTLTRSGASLLNPLICKMPITISKILVIDETYERYAGYWGYYYATLDAVNRYLVAPYFSPQRNVKATPTVLAGTLRRIKQPPPVLYIIHDYFSTYFPTIQRINQSKMFLFTLKSLPVEDLKDPACTSNPYRRFKNAIK